MPIYEYECTTCGKSFEIMQKLSEPVLTDCPSCENGQVRRKIFAVGSIFKGSGFYATEYRSKDYVEREKAETEAEKQGTGSEKTPDKAPEKPSDDKNSTSAETSVAPAKSAESATAAA